MKKYLYGILYSLIAILFTTQVVLWADSVGINIKPTTADIPKQLVYDATYAKMDVHTSFPGLFFNLTTANSYQIAKPFSTSQVSSNMTADIPNGEIIVSTSGTYLVNYDYLFYATEGSQISIDILKNGVQQHRLTREMTSGPERFLQFANVSGHGQTNFPTVDISGYNSTGPTILFTNVTSNVRQVITTSIADGQYMHINEGTVTPGFVARYIFKDVMSPKKIKIINTAYDGANDHNIKVKAYNYSFNRYTSLSNIYNDIPVTVSVPGTPYLYYYRNFNIPLPNKNYVNGNNQTKILINHIQAGSGAHDFEIDKIELQDALNSIELFGQEYVTCVAGDVISLRIKSNLANTELFSYSHGFNVTKINR